MKKIITVLRKEVADQIADECGYNYMTQDLGGGKEAYSFMETEKLYKLLNDKRKFNRKDWFVDNRLRF